jgi:hypothetical protein
VSVLPFLFGLTYRSAVPRKKVDFLQKLFAAPRAAYGFELAREPEVDYPPASNGPTATLSLSRDGGKSA